MINTSFYP